MTTLIKPKRGEPCNRCGICCAAALCTIAEIAFPGAAAPCPALEWREEKSSCGMITNPARYVVPHFSAEDKVEANGLLIPLNSEVLGIGKYCDSEDEE